MKILNKLYPKISGEMQGFFKETKEKKLNKEQAMRILLKSPEFLDPVLFVLFTLENNVVELSYKNYIIYMKNKGIKAKNKNLVLAAEEALLIQAQAKL
ncbi:hypothetical protein J8N01_25965 [Priestia megaterium]|uniref:hypothetical protein n=1 Tax=Priestia megaterium TaxID=1404 RepID=UPI002378E91B|nr:hypothetical protein [Priestia megaterium]WDM33687.1 hypothetical protein J8N01_25965 [Priestia megaterium]